MATPTFSSPTLTGGNSDEVFELSWELFGELCRALALRVYRDYDPDLVVGIATAGVIPAAVIADIGKPPLDVALATGPGADLVINLLGRAAYGGGA